VVAKWSRWLENVVCSGDRGSVVFGGRERRPGVRDPCARDAAGIGFDVPGRGRDAQLMLMQGLVAADGSGMSLPSARGSGGRFDGLHRQGWLGFPSAVVAVLTGTAVLAYILRNGWIGIDLDNFALAGRTMFSHNWPHTYHNPFFQAGPIELGLAAICTWLAGSSGGLLAPVCDLPVAVALLAVTTSFFGRRGLVLLAVGVGAFVLGGTRDPYIDGHFADSVNALLWLLAAREARRDRVFLAGLLVGVSAGFELWGLLGVSVLALAPTLRRAALGAAVAVALGVSWFAPFALGGDFHMFSYKWHVTGGLMGVVLGVGHPFGWALRLVQGAVTVVVAAVLARKTRAAPISVFAIPLITGVLRLALDPMSINYYWDGTSELALLCTAFILTQGSLRNSFAVETRRPFRENIPDSPSS
jgi:hypothetical protein